MVNALRAVMYEYGHVFPLGITHLKRIEAAIEKLNGELPELVLDEYRDLILQIAEKTARIEAKTKKAKVLSKKADLTRQLQTMPGVGPLTALAIEALHFRWIVLNVGGILPPGLVWSLVNIRQAAGPGLGGSQKQGRLTFAGF